MTYPPVRPDPPEVTPGGYAPRYVSPHGHLDGLRGRVAHYIDRMGRDKTLPWVGLGLVRDLEVILQLLNLQEFAEWLRTKGDSDQARFGDEILRNQETIEAVEDALRHEGHEGDPVVCVERMGGELKGYWEIRKVLVERGALEDSDRDTPLEDLVRALLS